MRLLLIFLLMAVNCWAAESVQILDEQPTENGYSKACLDQFAKYKEAKIKRDYDGMINYAVASWVKAWALNNKAHHFCLHDDVGGDNMRAITLSDAQNALVILNEALKYCIDGQEDAKVRPTIQKNIDAANWVITHRIEKDGTIKYIK